ncbi:hypothetical protein, partial [Staphylococcus aureus]
GNLQPRYNISPTTQTHIIVRADAGREPSESGRNPGRRKRLDRGPAQCDFGWKEGSRESATYVKKARRNVLAWTERNCS